MHRNAKRNHQKLITNYLRVLWVDCTLLSFNNGSPWKSVVFICIGKLLPFRNKLTCIAKPRVQLISYESVWCRLNVDTGYLTHHRQWFINMRMLGERFVVVSMVAGSTPFSTSILMVSDSFIIVRNVIEFHSAFNWKLKVRNESILYVTKT